MTSANTPVRCDAVTKRYGNSDAAVTAVDRVSVAFVRGQLTSIMGPSGSGKTTLLQLLAGLDQPTEGEVHVAGKRLGDLSDNALTDLRRDHVGFIFQAFNLIPSLTAEQNITLPLMIGGKKPDQQRVAQIADLLGLTDRLRHRPAQLSGGQQQRVAIARALVTRPEVIFADEPTGSLDTATGQIILSELRMACRELGQTIIMVTHDPAASSYSDRCLLMADGQIRAELTAPNYAQITEEMARISAAANLTGAVLR